MSDLERKHLIIRLLHELAHNENVRAISSSDRKEAARRRDLYRALALERQEELDLLRSQVPDVRPLEPWKFGV